MTQTLASPATRANLLPPAGREGTGRMSPGIKVAAEALGPLGQLPGTWTGTGFNVIWRPRFDSPLPKQHFLQLNLTQEIFTVNSIGGEVPNRGLVQSDINLTGVRYLQQIHDGSGFVPPAGGGALHIEPGFWLTVPATTNPKAGDTVARLASVPHGNSVMAIGTAEVDVPGPPEIRPASITPFGIRPPHDEVAFPESDLGIASPDQRSTPLPDGIDQDLVNDPNLLLTRRLHDQTVVSTTTLRVSTRRRPARIDNIPFLKPNADAVDLDAIFWIETIRAADGSLFLQLQYSQTLMLNFNGLSWPHVSVANLVLTGA